MTTYALADGMTLVVRIDGGHPISVVFSAPDFQDIAHAAPDEVVAVLATAGVPAAVDQGDVVIASSRDGERSRVAVDFARSTAAPALGLTDKGASAAGTGPRPARVPVPSAAPYAMPRDAEMMLAIDGDEKRIVFRSITDGAASAEEIAEAINRAFPGVADVARRRVAIVSRTEGAASTVNVGPGRVAQGKVDAAVILGFAGGTAAATGEDRPRTAATLRLRGRRASLHVHNLTASPIQFVMVTRSVVVPAGGSVSLSPAEAAHRPLQRLLEGGAVRLSWSLTG